MMQFRRSYSDRPRRPTWWVGLVTVVVLGTLLLVQNSALNQDSLGHRWTTTRGVVTAADNHTALLTASAGTLFCVYYVNGVAYAHRLKGATHKPGDSLYLRYALDEPYVAEISSAQ